MNNLHESRIEEEKKSPSDQQRESRSRQRSDSRSPSRYKSKSVKPEVVKEQAEERLIQPLQMHNLRERNASLRLDLSRSSRKNLELQSKIKELKDKAKSDREGR